MVYFRPRYLRFRRENPDVSLVTVILKGLGSITSSKKSMLHDSTPSHSGTKTNSLDLDDARSRSNSLSLDVDVEAVRARSGSFEMNIDLDEGNKSSPNGGTVENTPSNSVKESSDQGLEPDATNDESTNPASLKPTSAQNINVGQSNMICDLPIR